MFLIIKTSMAFNLIIKFSCQPMMFLFLNSYVFEKKTNVSSLFLYSLFELFCFLLLIPNVQKSNITKLVFKDGAIESYFTD